MKPIQFRRILCPINFSDGSRRTVEGASVLARMYNAELRLFHVVPDGTRTCDADSLIGALFDLARTLPERTRVSAAVAFGDPSQEIIQHARLMRADLVVLGSERQSGPADVRRTIVADVVTHTACPVLHVRPDSLPSPADGARGYTEIVCCVDDASGATSADAYARALAPDADARVTLLNVVEPDEDSESERDVAHSVDQHQRAVHISLIGSPGPEIVALARQIRADLIVIGAQDETSPTGRLGSTAAHVIVNAPCPVLITPRVHRAYEVFPQRRLQNEMTIAD